MSFDFGSLNNNKKNTSTSKKTSASKTPSKSTSKTSSSRTSSSKSSSRRSTRRSRSSNPLSGLFKGMSKKTYTYASLIGGFLILLIIVVFCVNGGSTSTPQSPRMDKRAYLEKANDYANNHEYEKAIDAYKKAYEIDPHDSYATDQISIIYRNNLHDESSAEYWKSKSEQITANKVDSNRGASAKAYEEKAAKRAQKRNGGR